MISPSQFTEEEAALLADQHFFLAKAQIMAKVRRLLEATNSTLKEEVASASLATPPDFDPTNRQFVKGESLEFFPYQYLDFPKHFHDSNTFTFRTLFWWGHHVVCALLLEGEGIKQHKVRIVNRFHQLAGQGLELSLAPTLWEWKRGEGYTLPITHDRKAQIAAVLAERTFLKIVRFLPFTDPRIQSGQMPEFSRETFRIILPIVTR
ncbi:MAG TPA: hypothetical protein VJT11_09880 [Nitrospiraceae bacterium]|nr:hypothetical protein [Nitrospiraceae bacterium]